MWEKIQTDPEKYLLKPYEPLTAMFAGEEPAVAVLDYKAAILQARSLGRCDWEMLQGRYMPLGYGIAFPQRSPYVQYFNTM